MPPSLSSSLTFQVVSVIRPVEGRNRKAKGARRAAAGGGARQRPYPASAPVSLKREPTVEALLPLVVERLQSHTVEQLAMLAQRIDDLGPIVFFGRLGKDSDRDGDDDQGIGGRGHDHGPSLGDTGAP